MQPKHSSLLTSAALCETSSPPACSPPARPPPSPRMPAPPRTPRRLLAPGEEKFLANVRQLTFGGQNAEAYWSADGTRLIFQSDEGKLPCDQIFTMKADGSDRRRVSNGEGKTTCSYFYPSGDRVLYASTFRASPACPPPPGPLARIRLGARRLRHLLREARRHRHQDALLLARVRRRGHDLARRQDDRLHVHARRRPRALHDERRRLEREAHDATRRATTAAPSSPTTASGSSTAPITPRRPRTWRATRRTSRATAMRRRSLEIRDHERRRHRTTTPSRRTAPPTSPRSSCRAASRSSSRPTWPTRRAATSTST